MGGKLQKGQASTEAKALIAHVQGLHALRRERKSAAGRRRRKALSEEERQRVWEKTAGKCHVCGGDVGPDWKADHVLAHSGGGIHSADNYLPAHPLCNNYRWDYLAEELQLILRLGVWAKTQIERETQIG